jgi:hypothetical protein
VLADCDDQQFQQIAVASFSERLQFHSGALAKAFADFVTSKVLPDCEFDPNGPEYALFQFLAFLLPIDASPMLESPAYRAMRTALDANVDYVEDVLLQSLAATFTVHRPFVWRLLSAAERKTHLTRALEIAIKQDRKAMAPSALAELDRFLETTQKWAAEVK